MDKTRRDILIDFYEKLLTDRQREILKYFIDEDLSLSEISLIVGISRQAVHDSINKSYEKLEEYEKKLGLYKDFIIQKESAIIIEEIIDNINISDEKRNKVKLALEKILY